MALFIVFGWVVYADLDVFGTLHCWWGFVPVNLGCVHPVLTFGVGFFILAGWCGFFMLLSCLVCGLCMNTCFTLRCYVLELGLCCLVACVLIAFALILVCAILGL